mmetsp:Transcript_9918/g.14905  ORF Transcript_9918/g.14905 Transcript_9918/m.14905 type:complete len:313 (+) Transcript_9918:39-977(+)
MDSKKPGVVFADKAKVDKKVAKTETKEPKGILKKNDTKAQAVSEKEMSDRIKGVGNTVSSNGTESQLLEKTMDSKEKKTRIKQLKMIFPHFNNDYSVDLLRKTGWDVEMAIDLSYSGILPSFLKNADPSTYIHDPNNFLEPPQEMLFTGRDAKTSSNMQAALLSVQGTRMEVMSKGKEGFIGPVQASAIISPAEKNKKITGLIEVIPHFSKGYAYEFLSGYQWDVNRAVEAVFSGQIPAALQGKDPSTYVSQAMVELFEEKKRGKKPEKKVEGKNDNERKEGASKTKVEAKNTSKDSEKVTEEKPKEEEKNE